MAITAGNADALNNRGNVLVRLGRHEEAVASYDQALAMRPEHVEALVNRGNALVERDRYEEAVETLRKALVIRPADAKLHNSLGYALRGLGRVDEASDQIQQSLAIDPHNFQSKLDLCMAQLPIVYREEAEVIRRRSAYEQRLKDLISEFERKELTGDLVEAVGTSQPFLLAYQGLSDRDLQRLYGKLVCDILGTRYGTAPPPRPPSSGERTRVGIVSGFFWNHSSWKMPTKGWLTQLDRRQFEICCYHTGVRRDGETKLAEKFSDRFVQGPISVSRWREEILADAPHVLIYPEIGMDRTVAQLAAQRLAPTQCTSWGLPNTTGYPTIELLSQQRTDGTHRCAGALH